MKRVSSIIKCESVESIKVDSIVKIKKRSRGYKRVNDDRHKDILQVKNKIKERSRLVPLEVSGVLLSVQVTSCCLETSIGIVRVIHGVCGVAFLLHARLRHVSPGLGGGRST